jgi:hypothetical protein
MSVGVKDANKPPQLIRYVLSADPRLQRISLRKMSVRLKNARKSRRLKESGRARKSVRFPVPMNAQTVLLAVICIVAAAALIAARQPSQRGDVTTVDGQPVAAVRFETTKTVASKTPAEAAAAKRHAADARLGNTPVVESVSALAMESAPKVPTVESAAKAPAVESKSTAEVQDSTSVTITGCLEHDEETIWLKKASGTDAPKSRSWKSGFLKKRPAPIELVDTADLKLTNYAGQRVAATGMLLNRQMRVRSVQRVAASCS